MILAPSSSLLLPDGRLQADLLGLRIEHRGCTVSFAFCVGQRLAPFRPPLLVVLGQLPLCGVELLSNSQGTAVVRQCELW